jgi:cytochrome P450
MTRDSVQELPGPRGLEKWRIVPELVGRPHECLQRLATEYGDVVGLAYPTEYSVLVSNADYLEYLFHHNPRNYDKQTPRWGILRQIWGNGLLTADGELWRKQRQRIQPAFHQECMENFAAIVADEAAKLVQDWSASAAAGQPRDVYPDMLHVGVRTVTRALFSADIEGKTDLITHAVLEAHEFINPTSFANMFHLPEAVRRVTVPGFRKFQESLRTIHATFDEILRTRLERRLDRPDLLGMMMAARDEGTAEGMSLEQLHDEMTTMLMSGYETTGITTTWTWYWLSQHQDVQRKLQAEADSVLGGRQPIYDDIPRLQYARMVFQESMRLNPAVWAIERKARAEDVVGGYRIPAGATVITCPYILHRDPRYWTDPLTFNPERFLPDEETKRPQYAYFPFGGGPRRCVGLRVAMLYGPLIHATLGQSFTLRLKPGHPVAAAPKVNLQPKYGMQMLIEPRRAAMAAAATS